VACCAVGVLAISGGVFAGNIFKPVAGTGGEAPAGPLVTTDGPAGDPSAAPGPAGQNTTDPGASATAAAGRVPSRKPTPTGRRTNTAQPQLAGAAAEVVVLVNQERTRAGCGALSADSRLNSAAQAHSADMARRGYFDHNTPEGVTPFQRMTAAGYNWSAAGENIAEGYTSPASVMQAWMNSPDHRANILNCGFRNIGVGLAYNGSGTSFWTQDFGTPR
jgi:uncharacterized protein YkwD